MAVGGVAGLVFLGGLHRFAGGLAGIGVLQLVHLLLLVGLEGAHAFQHLVEVHLVAVELGAVDADKLGLAAHGDAAGAAHARAVHHDGVERYVGGDVIFLGQQADELHHDGRADGEALVHLLAQDDLFHAIGHQTFLPVAAVVGHDDDLVAGGTHLFFQDNQFLGASGQDGDDAIAGSLQSLYDGQHRGDSHAASGADHGAELLDVRGLSQGAYDVGDVVAFVQFAEAGGGEAYFLHHEGDGAGHGVSFGNGEGHTFALLAHTDDNEVPGLARPGDERCFNHELEDLLGEMFFVENLVHIS